GGSGSSRKDRETPASMLDSVPPKRRSRLEREVCRERHRGRLVGHDARCEQPTAGNYSSLPHRDARQADKDSAPQRRALLASKRLECRTQVGREQLGLLPSREVTALVGLVVVDEIRERLLGPTAGSRVELVRKRRHGDRDGDALHVEVPEFVLPIETSTR